MNFFKLTEGYPPRPVQKNYEKKYFAMKANGIRWRSWKIYWGPIFYVCSSERNKVSSMYKGI